MATLKEATQDAKFYKEVVVKVITWDGKVDFYSSTGGLYARRCNFIPDGYGGTVETVADYRG